MGGRTLSAPLERRVGVEIAAEVAGEQECLGVEEKADGDFIVEEGVFDFLLFAFLPVGEDLFPAFVVEQDGAGFGSAKVFGTDLLAVDKRQGKTIGEWRAKFFHEIEGESGAARTIPVEESDSGIKSVGGERTGGIESKERVEV